LLHGVIFAIGRFKAKEHTDEIGSFLKEHDVLVLSSALYAVKDLDAKIHADIIIPLTANTDTFIDFISEEEFKIGWLAQNILRQWKVPIPDALLQKYELNLLSEEADDDDDNDDS